MGIRHQSSAVVGASIGLLLAFCIPAGAAQVFEMKDSAAAIIVRTYTQPHFAGDLEVARRTATAILSRARIQAAWLECGPATGLRGLSERCNEPLQPNELVVRILSAGSVAAGPAGDTLGFAFVDLEGCGGSLATIYADRVRAMAGNAGASAADILGKAMAHEIGHLLLGTNRHASNGLMRASWSGPELRRDRPDQWLFDKREGEGMRQRLATRSEAERN